MKNQLRGSYTIITIALFLFLVAGFISTIWVHHLMTYEYSGEGLEFPPSTEEYLLFEGLLLISSFILLVLGMSILLTSIKNPTIERHTKIGLAILGGGFAIICLLYPFFIFFSSMLKIDPTSICLYPLIHISIALPAYKLWGRWSIIVNVLFFIISIPMILMSTSNGEVKITMFLMVTYYLVPFVINIIVYRRLLIWAKLERIKTLLEEKKMISNTLKKLKADIKVHGFPEVIYEKIVRDNNDRMNEILKEIKDI